MPKLRQSIVIVSLSLAIAILLFAPFPISAWIASQIVITGLLFSLALRRQGGLKNDRWIRRMAEKGMITPFEVGQISRVGDRPVISWGLGSFGYDLRLSPVELLVFRFIPGVVVDPKNFNRDLLMSVPLEHDEYGSYFTMPPYSYALGVAMEALNLPRYITVACLGKSTYARTGIIANVTPGEAGWVGKLTLEFSNSSPTPCRLYAGEGVVQLCFLEGEDCDTSYQDRNQGGGGKYQNQVERVTLAKV